MSSTKVVTGKVRLSYARLFEAQSFNGSDPKYSTVILIPKSDKETLKKIRNAQAAAAEAGKDKFKNKTIPKNLATTLRDGDEDADTMQNPEYTGHFYMNVSSKNKPGVVDRDLNPIIDAGEVYSGCYARVSLNFFAYNVAGKQGISAGLNNVQKIADGEPLGGSASSPESDFGDLLDDDEDDEDLI